MKSSHKINNRIITEAAPSRPRLLWRYKLSERNPVLKDTGLNQELTETHIDK